MDINKKVVGQNHSQECSHTEWRTQMKQEEISKTIVELEALWERLCVETNYERMEQLLVRLHNTMKESSRKALQRNIYYK